MKITPATPIEMIVTYAGLAEEFYDIRLSFDEHLYILGLAKRRFKKIKASDLDECGAFKNGTNYTEEYWHTIKLGYTSTLT